MAATVSGSKTCTTDLSPALTAARLTTLLAIAPENLTVGQMNELLDATHRVSGGGDQAKTVGSLLS